MLQNQQNNNERGVTLVELAIVVVIISLLLAAITAGRNISQAGKLRGVISEVETHRASFIRFWEKYNDLPGDMTDATTVFGCTDCDGNGNEQIQWTGGDINEGAMAWRHLQLARMFATDTLAGTGTDAIISVNVPASKMPGAGYYADYNASTVGNLIGLGAADGSGVNDGVIIKPEDAMSIDLKWDDGNALSGRVRAGNNVTPTNCSSGAGIYNLTVTAPQCYMVFQLDNSM